jgi:NADPH:quinone reductase-like Zn-dependent oxidoreductase
MVYSVPPRPPPFTIGHELSGIVRDKGRNVRHIEVGDRVGVNYMMSCGSCRYCLSGNDNLCDNLKVLAVNTDGSWVEKIVVNMCAFQYVAQYIILFARTRNIYRIYCKCVLQMQIFTQLWNRPEGVEKCQGKLGALCLLC